MTDFLPVESFSKHAFFSIFALSLVTVHGPNKRAHGNFWFCSTVGPNNRACPLVKTREKIPCARLLATYTVIKPKAKNVMCTLIEDIRAY